TMPSRCFRVSLQFLRPSRSQLTRVEIALYATAPPNAGPNPSTRNPSTKDATPQNSSALMTSMNRPSVRIETGRVRSTRTGRMKGLIAVAILALATSWPAEQAHAQGKKMYKCGSQFQDRPCDGGPPAAAAKPAPAPAAPQKTASPAEEQRRQIRCDNWGRQVL